MDRPHPSFAALSRLAAVYDGVPDRTDQLATLWRSAGDYFRARADELGRRCRVTVVDAGQPYRSAAAMFGDLDGGRFTVTAEHSAHPVWPRETNVAFRTCHDIDAHYAARGGFDLEGEWRGWLAHSAIVPTFVLPVLWSEHVLQLASTLVAGRFPAQRLVVDDGWRS